MSEELKPCPFCGFEAVITKYNSNIAACNNPGCPNEIHDEVGLPTITIAQWNSRPIEDALRKQLAIAVEAIKAFLERLDNKSNTSMDATIYVIEGLRNALEEIEKIKP